MRSPVQHSPRSRPADAARQGRPRQGPRVQGRRDAFYKWLGKHHSTADEVWIRIHKVGSGLKSITPTEAIDAVLCWGWIDAIRKGFDDKSFLQRYTPRGKKSTWSQINVGNVARLIEEGRMTEHGLKQVEAAKADGRWDRAYRSGMKMPDDLQAAIDAEPKAKAMLAKAQRAEPFRAGIPYPQHEDRSRAEKEDRDLRRDAQARRDDLPAG